ncbi:MAG TPA: pyridoxal phosphate-dependent aminotransferase, partial [Petrotoga sp.]|nr:pyridoxal phosphate-dependent aminotransferase [Petrotoga sp.]
LFRSFYATPGAGKQEIRIAYVLNSEELRKACNILKEAVIVYNERKINVR